jgi:hypothetical protein
MQSLVVRQMESGRCRQQYRWARSAIAGGMNTYAVSLWMGLCGFMLAFLPSKNCENLSALFLCVAPN